MQRFTKHSLIDQAKAINVHDTGIVGIYIPVITLDYPTFAERAGINQADCQTLGAYIKKVSYAEKRAVFEPLGFTVSHMSLSTLKTRKHALSTGLNHGFTSGALNAIIIEVESLRETLYFALGFDTSDGALIHDVADPARIEQDQADNEALKKALGFGKYKKATKPGDTTLPF